EARSRVWRSQTYPPGALNAPSRQARADGPCLNNQRPRLRALLREGGVVVSAHSFVALASLRGETAMSTHTGTWTVEIPRPRWFQKRGPRYAAGIALATGLFWTFGWGYGISPFRSSTLPDLELVEVDRGDLDLVVIERGSIESSDEDVVRCRVESFQGL